MEILSALNLEQLGTAGVMLGYLIWQNHCLREDLKAEREYSKDLGERIQGIVEKFTATMSKQETAFALLKDGLK